MSPPQTARPSKPPAVRLEACGRIRHCAYEIHVITFLALMRAAGSGPEPINGELHIALDRADFLVLFPSKQDGSVRLVGTVRKEPERKNEKLSWHDVSKRVIDSMRIDVEKVNWFSTYHCTIVFTTVSASLVYWLAFLS